LYIFFSDHRMQEYLVFLHFKNGNITHKKSLYSIVIKKMYTKCQVFTV